VSYIAKVFVKKSFFITVSTQVHNKQYSESNQYKLNVTMFF